MKANKVYSSKERVYIFRDRQLERAAKKTAVAQELC